MATVKHHIFGNCEFVVLVETDSNCAKCIHLRVCKQDMNNFCENYRFGTSEYSGCHGCLHRYTKWDKNPIPCFKCKYEEVK